MRWDQAELPGGGEPEHPAPVLTLTEAERCLGRRPSHCGGGVGGGRQLGALAGRRRADGGRRGSRGGTTRAAAIVNRVVAVMVLAIGLAAAALAGAGTASAHATRIATDPVENTELTQAPPKVSATFNEALQPEFAAMTVVGPDGNLWSTGDPQVEGAVLSVGVRPLGPGGHLHGELPGDVG